ncbi:DNA-directed RNA polymerase subunit omega [Romboutsia lituseburensis]|uniref:DNA-directed RNA polymerase subunit omega n=2 Tax=root TaxID=1 RepID=A0A1G9QCC8_9FIRM|nr:DNA-directed RNA polymerase subunit omega [Romboutsia lituseburensis]MCR8745302.1 DNA-directed RNA polymerase subunit omega [Romboutsia lituseburensis]CEH35448.1 rpoZ: DNA-directed RNA polymerase, omega subunit [Romboutsia lituseburensis]SDM08688.1 DNA-directed RNA polymerase subunit omega [Romboutsia lituseburensis DSM 797]
MLKPSINEVLDRIDNRYYLVGTVAKRAREIIDGSELYIYNKKQETKPVSLATQEVADGKITYRLLTQEEIDVEEARHHEEQQKTIEQE